MLYYRAELWAKRHIVVFALQKYKLLYFIYKGDQKRFESTDRALNLGPRGNQERVISATQYAQYLGVILDDELNSLRYMEHIKERVTKSIQAMRSISEST